MEVLIISSEKMKHHAEILKTHFEEDAKVHNKSNAIVFTTKRGGFTRTRFEMLKNEVRRLRNNGIVIFLLGPDDKTKVNYRIYKNIEKCDSVVFSSSANVLFELGFFLGRLNEGRVYCIEADNIQRPKDLEGVEFIKYRHRGKISEALKGAAEELIEVLYRKLEKEGKTNNTKEEGNFVNSIMQKGETGKEIELNDQTGRVIQEENKKELLKQNDRNSIEKELKEEANMNDLSICGYKDNIEYLTEKMEDKK